MNKKFQVVMSFIVIVVMLSACTTNKEINLSITNTATSAPTSLPTSAPTSSVGDSVLENGGILATLQIDDRGQEIYSAEKTKIWDIYKVIIGKRLKRQGILNFSLNVEESTQNLKIEIPKSKKTVKMDAKKLIESLIFVSRLYFQEVKAIEKPVAGSYALDGGAYQKVGPVLLEAGNLSDATIEIDTLDQGSQISLEFTPAGQKKFFSATQVVAKSKNYLGIFLDKRLFSAPLVYEPINSSSAIITGKFSEKEAIEISSEIKAGITPFAFKILSVEVFA